MHLFRRNISNHSPRQSYALSHLNRHIVSAMVAVGVALSACTPASSTKHDVSNPDIQRTELASRLYSIADGAHGCIGIALITNDDTLTVNNGVRYAMMSVFKLHQALAVADAMQKKGASLDSTLCIQPSELDHNTWSPMLKEKGRGPFTVSVSELIQRAIVSSDNNASNLLFSRIISPVATDTFVHTVAADTTFAIRYSEAEMKSCHQLCYSNYSSPLAAATLIRQVFTTDILPSGQLAMIREWLSAVTTGHNRLGAATEGVENVLFAHKTGSGFRNDAGELMAFNDVAYFRLPDGRDYALAVMIRDFAGSEDEAAAIMAKISKTVYSYMTAER